MDDSVSLSSSVNLGINSTVSFWIKRDRVNSIEMFLGELSYSNERLISIGNTNNYIWIEIDGVYQSWTGTDVILNNTIDWFNICFIRSGDSIELFINGVSYGVNTGFGTSIDTKFDTIAAQTSSNTYVFQGNIDEIAGWSTNAINPTDIYNGGTPTTLPSGAVAHYKMGEEANFTSNWTVPDAAGSNDGTSANMTVEDRVGEAPNSENNALSFNMDLVDRTTDVPT